MGKLSESWMRWWRSEGPGGRWPQLSQGQAQMIRYLLVLLGAGILLMSLNPREPRPSELQGQPGTPSPTVAAPGAPGTFGATAVPAAAGTGPSASYARELEEAVAALLSQLPGVHRVHVSVTLATGPELVVAEQVDRERRVSEEPAQGGGTARVVTEERSSAQPVILRRDQGREEQALVLLERAPEVQGVVVVAEVAPGGGLRLELARAVATLLGVPPHRVYVITHEP